MPAVDVSANGTISDERGEADRDVGPLRDVLARSRRRARATRRPTSCPANSRLHEPVENRVGQKMKRAVEEREQTRASGGNGRALFQPVSRRSGRDRQRDAQQTAASRGRSCW